MPTAGGEVTEKNNVVIDSNYLFVATSATNIDQWKRGVKGLKNEGFKYYQAWLVEQPGRTNGIPLLLKGKGGEVVFRAVLVNITAENITGVVKEAEMQSEKMDIEGIKKIGLQICKMNAYDPADFLAWCDRVGNHFDSDPYYTKGRNPIGFRMLNAYDQNKPWCLLLQIQTLKYP